MAILPTLLRRLTLATALLALPSVAVQAQSRFDTVARVNDSVVTRFEVQQRARLLAVLGSQQNPDEKAALDELVEDRLKLGAAVDAGIEPTSDDLAFAMENFAGRANLTTEEFLLAIGDAGIEPETFRDYIRVLLVWGDVIRERFAPRARPSEEEVDRALALGTGEQSTRVKLAEIILPMDPQRAAISEQRAQAIQNFTSFAQFSTAARQFSISPSRANGGELEWRKLSELPPQIAPLFLTMQPGEVTEPLSGQVGLILFQLRGLQDSRPQLGGNVTLDYIRVTLPAGRDPVAEQARLRDEVDRCDDFFGVYFGSPAEQIQRDTVERSKLPGDLARKIDTLDEGEMTVLGNSIVMLCSRAVITDEELTREDVQRQLFQTRLEAYGDSFLEELRASAFIEIQK